MLDGFVVQIEFESKNGSIVGQFVDCITRLVGMELKHNHGIGVRSLRDFAFNKMYLMRCFYTKMSALGVFQRLVLCVFIPMTFLWQIQTLITDWYA